MRLEHFKFKYIYYSAIWVYVTSIDFWIVSTIIGIMKYYHMNTQYLNA